MRFLPKQRQGSALLLSLWAILFIAISVVAVLAIVQGDITEAVALNEQAMARMAASSGLALGMSPQVSPGDSLLKGSSELGGRYEVEITSESARLDINQIAKNGQTDTLKRLLTSWGLSANDISTVIDSLLDWASANGSHRLHGAEDSYYGNLDVGTLPQDRTFSSVRELSIIKGMDVVAAKKPDWADYFTVWSGSPQIDLNDAPADLVAAACDVSSTRAQDFVRHRDAMKLSQIPEERRWTTISAPLTLLGIAPGSRPDIESAVTVSGELWRIESQAWVGQQRSVLGMVIRQGNHDAIYRYER